MNYGNHHEIVSGYQQDSHPRRPPRLDRVFKGVRPFYFITFNTWKRIPVLANTEIHNEFCLFCSRGREHGVSVGRYVIMPDHIHLFVVIAESGPTLPKWIKGLRTVLGKQLFDTGVEKPHWQEGFFDHILRSSDSYGEKWEYVRMNPVRKGLSDTPEEWPFQGELNTLRF